MDYGDLENQQFANYVNNSQNPTIEQILRNGINQHNLRLGQQQSQQSNVNWRIVLAAKDLLDDDSTYRLPIGFTFFSLIRIVFTLFALNYSKERSQFISVFTSVGLFKDLLQIFYNYMLFRQIQKLKKLLYQRIFDGQLLLFLNEIKDQDFSVKYKSSLVINCILKTNSFLRLFERLIKALSWALFLYSIMMISFTNLKKEISGISIPLIVVFTFNNYCIFTVMIVFFFYTMLFNITNQLKKVFFIFQARYNKYKIQRLIEQLPCTKYENIKDKENITSCAVCLVDYTCTDRVLQLSCSTQHHFHKECIKQWLDIKSNCPICRTPVFESIQNPTHQPSISNSTYNSSQIQGLNNLSQHQHSSDAITNVSSPTNGQSVSEQEIRNNSIRQKSKSDSSTPSSSELSQKIQSLISNQQFLSDMQNSVPNQQIVDMIEENLIQFEQYQSSQQQQQQQDTKNTLHSSSQLKP